MQPLVLLAAAATVPLPALFPGLASSSAHSQAGEFKLHLALAMVAYSLFVIALLHAPADGGGRAAPAPRRRAGFAGTCRRC